MRWIIYILIVLALLLLAGYLFPREVTVYRSIFIDKPPHTVFPYLNNFHKFNEWSPWRNIDPSVLYEYSGPQEGIGAKMTWRGENSEAGSGSQTIFASKKDSVVATKLEFGDGSQATAEFQLEPKDGGTQITWSFHSDTGGGPRERWMGLAVKKMVGESYEQGLEKLKNLVETAPENSPSSNSASGIPSDVDDAMGGGPQGVQSELRDQDTEEAGETPENEQ
ncbi:SRPBCC family protein [Microbulbifer sp. OS29]|uniref:SRPBCC family protein n=1 Tax=Microbulbifer okhotskensis TaxID=2926617 RepID=A0A9X2J6V9_9GAMM|nr:SRPBCC family protein [Microbulbifer okhotskensis]MCO1335055.1 SRPBCC family protein [Microbulbifer okhotskensis]